MDKPISEAVRSCRRPEQRVTLERLREALAYCPKTGRLTWRNTMSARRKAGALAGNVNPRGYRRILLDRIQLSANRVAWALFYGEWPDPAMEIDHANGERADDRIENLRMATPTQNRANSVNRGDLPKGVARKFRSSTFSARIDSNGRSFYLGSFRTPDEAGHAYNKAAITLHGEFARLNPVGIAATQRQEPTT